MPQPIIPTDAQTLRRRAEVEFQKKSVDKWSDLDQTTSSDAAQTVHELQVHQIELEMQNEELRQASMALMESQARYFDLYDLAPMGLCSVNEKGVIIETNLAAASVLGLTRSSLLGQTLSRFVVKQDQDAYYLWRSQVLEIVHSPSCEIRMRGQDGVLFWALLNAIVIDLRDSQRILRVVLSDVTERKTTEVALLDAQQRLRHFTLQQQEEFDALRAELARDVHDQLGQTLAALKLEIDMIRDTAPAAAARMQQLIQDGVGSVRVISRALRPVTLDLGLISALNSLAADLTKRSDVDITTRLPEALPELPGLTERGLYRIAQEALNNALNHAQASKIEISLNQQFGQVELTINDDGQGFLPDTESVHRGLGLLGMRERARQLGSVLQVRSRLGHGTCIEVTLIINSA
jgi:PAS domain S-box-containing protein